MINLLRSRLFWIALLIPAGFALAEASIFEVPPEHRAVLQSRFGGGTVMDRTLPPGRAFKWPWDTAVAYDMQPQTMTTAIRVLGPEGVASTIDLRATVRLNAEKLTRLHKEVGPSYLERVVKPELAANLRTNWSRCLDCALDPKLYVESLEARWIELVSIDAKVRP